MKHSYEIIYGLYLKRRYLFIKTERRYFNPHGSWTRDNVKIYIYRNEAYVIEDGNLWELLQGILNILVVPIEYRIIHMLSTNCEEVKNFIKRRGIQYSKYTPNDDNIVRLKP